MAAIHDGAASLIDAIDAAMTDAGEFELATWRTGHRRRAVGAHFIGRHTAKSVFRNSVERGDTVSSV